MVPLICWLWVLIPENQIFLGLAQTHPNLEWVKRELGSWKRGEWMRWWGRGAGRVWGSGQGSAGWGWRGGKRIWVKSLWASEVTSLQGGWEGQHVLPGATILWHGVIRSVAKTQPPHVLRNEGKRCPGRWWRRQTMKAQDHSTVTGCPWVDLPGEMQAGFFQSRPHSLGSKWHQPRTHCEQVKNRWSCRSLSLSPQQWHLYSTSQFTHHSHHGPGEEL